jgi:hypothetical protein
LCFSALTITTSGIRAEELRSAGAEEDAAGKSHYWNSFFDTALGKKLHRGAAARKGEALALEA